MKIFGITIVSVAALLGGAKLVLAAFAPVLPPDFDRRWERDYATTYSSARWGSHEHIDFFAEHGRWPASVEELMTDGPDWYGRMKARNESGWRDALERRREMMSFLRTDPDTLVVNYRAVDVVDRREVYSDDVTCTITLDAEYAAAYTRWASLPGRTSWSEMPEEIDLWAKADCRRWSGVRGWLSWAGLNRYRRPPPRQYAAEDYTDRALRFDEVGGIPGPGVTPPR